MKHIIGGNPAHAIPQSKTVTVEEDFAGQRLDNFLMRELKGVPKTHVYRIIRSGEVRINKGRASADTRVQAGDLVRLPPVRQSERALEKQQAMQAPSAQIVASMQHKTWAILFEDAYFLAVDKPAGVAVHGGSGVSFGVIEQLRMSRPQEKFLELVHRLDRETSGILLVAKKRSALTHLQDQFRNRATDKVYLAMVAGAWPANRKVLDQPLFKYVVAEGKDQEERRVKVVSRDDPNGMPSLTLVKVRGTSTPDADCQRYSLLEVTIKTGRTHQIRVHLASQGMPIVGDDKYGDFDRNRALARHPGLRRMFLHAWSLQCNHPLTGERIALRAELPSELSQFLHHVMPSTAA